MPPAARHEKATKSPEITALESRFQAIRQAQRQSPAPTYRERMEHLGRLRDALRRHQEDVVAAVSRDFGHRSRHESLLAEVFVTVEAIKHARAHLKSWMKPSSRAVPFMLRPGKAEVIRQPLGLVGIISPWNYPAQLALSPLVGAVAAGNHVMIKPSEYTPATAEMLRVLLGEVFDPGHVAVVTGGAEVGAAFAGLPFDHLLFTGSPAVGRLVMQAAAKNLTPVTLELGGKSPAIVHAEFPIDLAASRILTGKLFNAGQTCIAPDYVMVPRGKEETFLAGARAAIGKQYPTLAANPDYSSMIHERHRTRLLGLIDDARKKGARIEEVNPAGEDLDGTGKLAPTLVLGATEEMVCLQEEIFGPVLPVLGYDHVDDAIAYVNARPRPLALYYFDRDDDRGERLLERTVSGGACINDTMLHILPEDLPFGGVGPSGMGAYHGERGFDTFSHLKGVFKQSRLNAASLIAPPYGMLLETLVARTVGKP
jgi:coniferyl-aldehyde dehydrogenase